MCLVVSVLSCTGQASLKFVERQDAFVPDSRSVLAFISVLRQADADRAASMLDDAFRRADSLAALKSSSETVGRLSDMLFAELTGEGASVRDYELAAMMLEREVLCTSLDPVDFKRIDYKTGKLNLNRPGFMVNDFPGGNVCSVTFSRRGRYCSCMETPVLNATG